MRESTRRRLEFLGLVTPREDRWRVPTGADRWIPVLIVAVGLPLQRRFLEELGYARWAILFVPTTAVATIVITVLAKVIRRRLPGDSERKRAAGSDSKWFFQRADFRMLALLIVLPFVAGVGGPYLFRHWAARVACIGGAVALFVVLGRAMSMGVLISGDSVTVRNFSRKTQLRADEIERFAPPERDGNDPRPARVLLKDGTAIPIRALKPRRGKWLTGERSLREQVARMNELLGKPED